MTPPQAVTDDTVLGGRVRLRQPARGAYRVNVDTVLLAAAVPLEAVTMLEAGCGVGGALLCVAARRAGEEGVRIVGVERDPALAALARDNVAANGFADHVSILTEDVFALPADLGTFDAVFFNPPYDEAGQGRAPAPGRQAAHVAERPIEAWVRTLSDRLAGGGTLAMIQRAHKLPEILRALEGRLGGTEVLPIHPRADAPARRIIVRARKGSRAPLRIAPGLVLHPAGEGAKHTPEAEAILRGEAALQF